MGGAMEWRTLPIAASASGTGSRRFRGYAAVYGSPSLPLPFIETIRAGAFDRTLRSGTAVRLLWNHDPSMVLASTARTLTLTSDARGLLAVAALPGNGLGQYAAEAIERRDVTGMSFGFVVRRDRWNAKGTERELLDIELREVSLVGWPAYPATSADLVRAMPRISASGATVSPRGTRHRVSPDVAMRLNRLHQLEARK